MNIQQSKDSLNLTGVRDMCYSVFFITRWLKEAKYCGEFQTLCQANKHIDFLQQKLPNGRKISFRIEGKPLNSTIGF